MEKENIRKMDSELGSLDFIDSRQIPLPEEIPKNDVEKLIKTQPKSSAIETLILQNEDLMSRLAVNIRRSSLLEETIDQLHNKDVETQKQLENIKDQLLILKKKDRMISQRQHSAVHQEKELKEKIQFLEQKYAEYYTITELELENRSSDAETMLKKLKRLQKYRRHIQPLSRKLNSRLRELRTENKTLREKKQTLEENLEKAANHINFQANAFEKEKNSSQKEFEERVHDLTQKYSEEITQISQNLKEKSEHNEKLKQQIDKMNIVYDENIELKNDLIQFKRQSEQLKSTFEEDTQKLQEDLTQYRLDLKNKVIHNKKLSEQVVEATSKSKIAQGESQKMKEQVESLQLLWNENQQENENFRQKNSSLQKLNQELSLKLNQQRTEIKKLKNQMDQSLLHSRQEIKQLKMKMTLSNKQSESHNQQESIQFTQEIIDKMENLICEIQTGFDRTDPLDLHEETNVTPPQSLLTRKDK